MKTASTCPYCPPALSPFGWNLTKANQESIASWNWKVHKQRLLQLCFDKIPKVIRTQLHTISQLGPILRSHSVAPGRIRLSTSWWPRQLHEILMCAQVQGQRENSCIFSGNSCSIPNCHSDWAIFASHAHPGKSHWGQEGVAIWLARLTSPSRSAQTAGTRPEGREEQTLVRHQGGLPFPFHSLH